MTDHPIATDEGVEDATADVTDAQLEGAQADEMDRDTLGVDDDAVLDDAVVGDAVLDDAVVGDAVLDDAVVDDAVVEDDVTGESVPEEEQDSEAGPGSQGAPEEHGVETAAGSRRSGSADRTAALEREGEVAADYLERLLDIADLDGDIDVDIDGDRAAIAVVDSEDGRVPRRLVGTDGRVLEALQELTRMAVQAATGERSRLMLDVAGHRAERRKAVVAQATTAIEKCKETGDEQHLEPMSAFERKVAHDAILAAGLTSESEGVEPRRHVVVMQK